MEFLNQVWQTNILLVVLCGIQVLSFWRCMPVQDTEEALESVRENVMEKFRVSNRRVAL